MLRWCDFVLLALQIVALPMGIHAQMNEFMYRLNIGDPILQFYSPSQLSKAEETPDLPRKKSPQLYIK